MSQRFDVCVQGAGPVGMALALSLARQGLSVAWRAPEAGNRAPASDAGTHATVPDIRTYALGARSVELLQTLKVWSALPDDARTRVADMAIDGDADDVRLNFRAGAEAAGDARDRAGAGLQPSGKAAAVDDGALAWIVDAAELEAALRSALRFAPHVTAVAQEVPAALLAICEGRDAPTRERLGVAMPLQDYGQRAIAARLVASQPHRGIARQWFRSPDVLALLPFDRPQRDHGLGLVWSLPTQQATSLMALDDTAFEQALQAAVGPGIGPLRLAGPRASWPLCRGQAERLCGPGWVLLGDAAHVIHPLAGQGLNLGLADVAVLARVLAEREPHRALGDEKLLRRYARERYLPVAAMSGLTDGLVQLFAHRHPLARELRNRGMSLLDSLAPFKRFLAERARLS